MTISADTALQDAARTVGLDARDAVSLRQHANTIFLLRREGVVVRLAGGSAAEPAVRRAVAITRWLETQDFPAPVPVSVEQPLTCGDWVISFWKHYPQDDRSQPSVPQLGDLLRLLHTLPSPPIDVPAARPLASLQRTVRMSTFLPEGDREWLLRRRSQLLHDYGELEFALGSGFIHGDAYPGNLLWDGDRVLLGDWDEVAHGPRELDLANTYQGVRFGRTSTELTAFAKAYGYDLRDWVGLPVLCSIRDLHTLGSYIRLADAGHEEAADQLSYRIATLRMGDKSVSWLAR